MTEPLRFDRFYNYEDLTAQLMALAARRPDLMSVESIGKSYEGRDIWCATVTNGATGPAAEKPAFWIDANIHATEVSASVAALYLLNKLVSEYGDNAEVTRCLDTRAFYVVPRMNPDGPERFFADPPEFLRSSTRPYPFDEEPIDGLKRQDVDGDGRMLSMRVVDPDGAWKQHPQEPRLLVRREPEDVHGLFYRLLPEGLLENWDGVTLKGQPPKERLDLNRNFPANWRQEHEQYGAGPFPTSEPEVRAIVAFITSHPNITGGITFHTYGGLLLRPFGTQNDETFAAEDLWTYQKIGARGTEWIGYPALSVYHDFRYHPKEVITGVFDDWMFDHLGLFAWTVEIWCPQRQAGIQDHKPIDWYREHPLEDDLKMLAWSDTALEGKGYIDWYPFEHPQLGPVEIGGWDPMAAFRNPPPQFLEAEVAKFPKWVLWQSLLSPRLELQSLEAAPVADGVYRLRLVVRNSGWLPSYVSKRALERKVARCVVAELTLPEGATLETGKVRTEMGHLEGRAYHSAAPYGWNNDGSEDRAMTEWVVRAKPGQRIQVTARCERAGTVRGDVTL